MSEPAVHTRERRVLVAGRGFIGSHLDAGLRGPGWRVAAADKEDLHETLAAFDPQVIVWAAGSRVADPDACQEQHVEAPLRALAAAPSARRFVYLSSGEVYGPQAVPFHESLAPQLGEHPYARAKVDGERALAAAARERGVALVVLRLPIVYGPGQTGPMLVPALVAGLLAGEPVRMTGGEQTRDFLYIGDVGELVRRCIADDAPVGTFNGSGGRETQVRELAQIVARAVSPAAEGLLDIGALPYRGREQMRYWLDATAARVAFDWRPEVDLREGVTRVVSVARRSQVSAQS